MQTRNTEQVWQWLSVVGSHPGIAQCLEAIVTPVLGRLLLPG